MRPLLGTGSGEWFHLGTAGLRAYTRRRYMMLNVARVQHNDLSSVLHERLITLHRSFLFTPLENLFFFFVVSHTLSRAVGHSWHARRTHSQSPYRVRPPEFDYGDNGLPWRADPASHKTVEVTEKHAVHERDRILGIHMELMVAGCPTIWFPKFRIGEPPR